MFQPLIYIKSGVVPDYKHADLQMTEAGEDTAVMVMVDTDGFTHTHTHTCYRDTILQRRTESAVH